MVVACLLFQNLNAQISNSPYEDWDWKKDGIWAGTALLGSAYGLSLIINKDGISEQELDDIVSKQDDIFFMDRWVAGNNSVNSSNLSDFPFLISFGAPLILLFDGHINDNTGQVMGYYLETMATTGALYGITAGLVNRSRPYVYSEEVGLSRRLRNNAQRSFFSGHTAATAASTFFVAKVYNDFYPDSPALPYIWTAAATIPAAVGYLRMRSGQHFLTDVMVGYTVGALIGYYVPELHKKENKLLTLSPVLGGNFYGENFNGMSFSYRF